MNLSKQDQIKALLDKDVNPHVKCVKIQPQMNLPKIEISHFPVLEGWLSYGNKIESFEVEFHNQPDFEVGDLVWSKLYQEMCVVKFIDRNGREIGVKCPSKTETWTLHYKYDLALLHKGGSDE